jgi:hypothetical protein
MTTQFETLYLQWRARMSQTHEEALKDLFGAATLEDLSAEHGRFARQLDAMMSVLATPQGFEDSLTPAQRLRLWQRENVAVPSSVRQDIVKHADKVLQAPDGGEGLP